MLIQINQQHRARYILSERRKHGYQQSYCPEYRMVRRLQLQKDCLLLVYRYLKDVLLLDFYTNSIGCKLPCSRLRRIEAEPRLNIRCISNASDDRVVRSQHAIVCVVVRGRNIQNYISNRYLDFFVPKSSRSSCYALLRDSFKHKKISGRV